jgi:predicted  nucleic acid-binding Zn-ribbon protein
MSINDSGRLRQQLDSANRQCATLRSKAAKQRNEIARLTKAIEELQSEKAKLIAEIKWMKGET